MSFNTGKFKELVSRNGKVRKWYEILKEGTESVIDRIFITGVAPITLDSLTSGFNIVSDITQDVRFNEMMGFTQGELVEMMEKIQISTEEQKSILPIMKENYDGYRFSINATEKMYNSNMCLYFLKSYLEQRKIPTQLIDSNIESDYDKLSNLLERCKGIEKKRILEVSEQEKEIVTDIVRIFNPSVEFGERELISMLFYLGYLTISGEEFWAAKLKIPNNVMKKLCKS